MSELSPALMRHWSPNDKRVFMGGHLRGRMNNRRAAASRGWRCRNDTPAIKRLPLGSRRRSTGPRAKGRPAGPEPGPQGHAQMRPGEAGGYWRTEGSTKACTRACTVHSIEGPPPTPHRKGCRSFTADRGLTLCWIFFGLRPA